jgi:hypothetical protein
MLHQIFLYYEFDSVGTKGIIKKAVIFTSIDRNVYNLALVTIGDDGYFDDTTLSNNGDKIQIMATVYNII